jgi:hypothetical protein
MGHDDFVIKINIRATAEVIYISSGNTDVVEFKKNANATVSNSNSVCCVVKFAKNLSKELFIQLFKDNFFSELYTIIRFNGIINLEIITPDHKVIVKNKHMSINKSNFPTSIIEELSAKFSSYVGENKNDILILLNTVGTLFGVSSENMDTIVNPLTNINDPEMLQKLFTAIMMNDSYKKLVIQYISSSGGIYKTINNYINCYKSIPPLPPFPPFPMSSTNKSSKIFVFPPILFILFIYVFSFIHLIIL